MRLVVPNAASFVIFDAGDNKEGAIMDDPKRERIGPFVITGKSNLSEDGSIICAQCGKLLSRYDKESDTHDPAPKQLIESGAIAVPNFGWFCGPTCRDTYGKEFGLVFSESNCITKI